MSNLPNYTSFQGVLDAIIRSYLLNELPPEVGESGIRYQNIAERDLGLSQAALLQNLRNSGANLNADPSEPNNNDGQLPGTSASAGVKNLQNASNEHEYVKALYQCFEKRGVFKELQTFLRHKLVSILQDEWPDLAHPSAAPKVAENTMVFRLLEDFLKCHRLLYTLSVLVSEADVKQLYSKELYGKLSAKEAEDLLNALGIKRSTRLSGQILKCYFDQENFSLLESMNYLGVWVDDSVEQQAVDNNPHESINVNRKNRRERRQSGESIFLSRTKPSGPAAMKDAPVQCEVTSENVLGVERRLLDLEKRLEMEKESKIREAIERYKNEDQARLREEMETNLQLKLISKEREHFLDIQKKIDEINTEVQRERQKWLEEKNKQERELLELRKSLGELSKHNLRKQVPVNGGMQPSTVDLAAKRNINYSPDDSPVQPQISNCGCDCKKKKSSRLDRKSSSMMDRESFDISPRYKPQIDAVQQDQLAFLQYRLEQQDDEIKSLRKQLLLSPRVVVASTKSKSTTVGGGDAPRMNARQSARLVSSINRRVNQLDSRAQDDQRDSSDDLGNFLNEAKTRVGKLDTAVSKVDEIVQELLAKRREATPISSQLSARLHANAEHRRLKRSLFTTTSSQYSGVLLSQGALVHQQLPEKQVKFTSDVTMYSPNHNYNVYDYQKQKVNAEVGAGAASGFKHVPSHGPSTSSQFQAVEEGPSTPVERIFPVAYGPNATTFQQPKKKSGENSINKSPRKTEARQEEEPVENVVPEPDDDLGESLFHMAAKQILDERRSESSKENSLEKRAIKHGALSRKKISSPDEQDDDGDCRSVSIAESISISLRKNKTVLTMVNGDRNGNGINHESGFKTEAMGKNEVKRSDASTSSRSDRIVKQSNGGKHSNLANKSNQNQPSTSRGNIRIAEGDAKHVALELSRSDRSNVEEETDLDENDFSNISAPKSDDIEDFWQI